MQIDIGHFNPEYIGLSGKSIHKINSWHKQRIPINKQTWDMFFLKLAYEIKEQSSDGQTKCGALLVRDKHIIATGYNGWMKEIRDDILPNIRPEKYVCG